jgi:hypothetical protein
VAVRATLSTPGVVAAGVVAPLLSGATVLLPDAADPDAVTGTVAIVADGATAPEPVCVDPGELGI